MRKKIFIALLIVLALAFVTMLVVPAIFKSAVRNKVADEISNRYNATVTYRDFSLSFFPGFPNLTFSLSGLTIVGIDSFKGDTLAYIEDFNVVIDIVSVIKSGKYRIVSIHIKRPRIAAIVNAKGEANWNIVKMMAAPGEAGNPMPVQSRDFTMEVGEYKITDASVNYFNHKDSVIAMVKKAGFSGEVKVKNELYDFATKAVISDFSLDANGIKYIEHATINAGLNLSFNQT